MRILVSQLALPRPFNAEHLNFGFTHKAIDVWVILPLPKMRLMMRWFLENALAYG